MAKRICVFCGSSPGARRGYAEAAKSLARYLAANRFTVVYGGGNVGLMGTLADATLEAGGEIMELSEALRNRELSHTRLPDLRVVGSMHERKAMMAAIRCIHRHALVVLVPSRNSVKW